LNGEKKILYIIFSMILISFLTINVCANPGADIDIKGTPSYNLHKDDGTRYYYFINITLENNGDEDTTETRIKLYEDDNPTLNPLTDETFTLKSGGEKSFTFDWPTTNKVQTVSIRWMPTDLNIDHDDTNYGNYSIQVVHPSVNTEQQTPGFEIVFLILSILSLVFFHRRKKT